MESFFVILHFLQDYGHRLVGRSLARRWTSLSVSASGIFHRGFFNSVRYGSALCGTVLEFFYLMAGS